MQAVRQMASGLPYAIVSVLLVIGSLSLALAEKNAAPPGPATATPTLAALSPSATSAVTATRSQTPVVTTAIVATGRPTATLWFPTSYVPVQPSPTTAKWCGPFPGWLKAYVVQPGDTLFRIAVSFGTSVVRLERANCKSSSVIYVGEHLWVPYAPTITAGITMIPTFDTPTDYPTEPPTSTATPLTETAVATATDTQDP